MNQAEIEQLLSALAADEVKNCSLLQFVRANPVLSIDRVGRSVLVRGRSDQDWIYASSSVPAELSALAARLGDHDDYYAAVEEWMEPILCRHRETAWRLPMVRFTLPADVALPSPDGAVSQLWPGDAAEVVRHSTYAELISLEYTRSRILGGPSTAIREDGLLVAWAMTQDDGAMGFLHVVDGHRRRGHARRITVALAAELRRLGRAPFAYVAEDNAAAIALVSGLGFERDRRVLWFKLR